MYFKFFYSVMISMLMLSITTLVEAKPDENTVAIWLFNEGNGKVVEDASKNGHAGEIIGNLEWVETDFGPGLKFPGDGSGYILIDSTKHLELHELSIEAFVKVEASTGKWQGIVCKQRAGCADRNYGIWVNPNTNALHAEIGANGQCGFNVGGQTILTDNEWHHLAFTSPLMVRQGVSMLMVSWKGRKQTPSHFRATHLLLSAHHNRKIQTDYSVPLKQYAYPMLHELKKKLEKL
ncbi:hypothetical protein C6501_08850 [Candidatus Poribacteria bacterium]|nr:MAG: hypothetical protein C6501_08850 [Candidatus Poribacteria bacterium]